MTNRELENALKDKLLGMEHDWFGVDREISQVIKSTLNIQDELAKMEQYSYISAKLQVIKNNQTYKLKYRSYWLGDVKVKTKLGDIKPFTHTRKRAIVDVIIDTCYEDLKQRIKDIDKDIESIKNLGIERKAKAQELYNELIKTYSRDELKLLCGIINKEL